jgi:adenosylmethionine-8-amino-7-oxononanoate aminotransferase
MRSLLPIARAEAVYLIDESGNKYIDAISSWWTNLHGHSHPHIAKRIYEQAQRLEHVLFAGCTHEPAVQLAESLLPLLPGNFSKVFYSDNGSTAVEVALKMAIQYWKNKEAGDASPSRPISRNKILALKNSYHGDTFGAMSVSERGAFTLAFGKYLFEVHFTDPASPLTIPRTALDEIACFIYEPLVQGAGGMRIYDGDSLNNLLCEFRQNGIICIADEVMTGFGRTGNLFASSYMHHKPDIICLSKGLTGGSLPLSITACTQGIFDAFLSDDPAQTFFHGHSYTANPLACAAGIASLDLLQQQECLDNIEYISMANQRFVEELKRNGKVLDPRSLGTIMAFEFNSGKHDYHDKVKESTMQLALKEGVFLRPLGNTIYIMPPYCITPVQLEKVYATLRKIIEIL